MSPGSSLVFGPTQPPLLPLSIASFLKKQDQEFGSHEAIVCPETHGRLTYSDLNERTKLVARALVSQGVRARDKIGIFSGNCERYVEVFMAAARIGATAVVLNNTYTAPECLDAINHTSEVVKGSSSQSILTLIQIVASCSHLHILDVEI